MSKLARVGLSLAIAFGVAAGAPSAQALQQDAASQDPEG